MTFTPYLPCVTRSGRKVEIIAVLPPEKMPDDGANIVALVYGHHGEGITIETYRPNGHYLGRSASVSDLVNVPVPVVGLEPAPPARFKPHLVEG